VEVKIYIYIYLILQTFLPLKKCLILNFPEIIKIIIHVLGHSGKKYITAQGTVFRLCRDLMRTVWQKYLYPIKAFYTLR